MVSDLLRQPGGFEGVGVALVCATPHAKTVAVAGEPAEFRIQRDAALEPGAKPAEREDGVPEVSNLLHTRLDFLEGGVPFADTPEALVTVVGVVALDLRRERVHSASGCEIQHRLDVAPVVGLYALPEQLDVLLDIAYSDRPAASRASFAVLKTRHQTHFPRRHLAAFQIVS